jgi:hypothetical protein
VVREGLADDVDDDFLGGEVAFGDRVDGAFQGDVVGFLIVLAQHRSGGQRGLPSHLSDLIQHFVLFHS